MNTQTLVNSRPANSGAEDWPNMHHVDMAAVVYLTMQEKLAVMKQPDGPPGIRGLSKTGERSDPTDNENGSLPIDGNKSVSSQDPSEDS